MSSDNDSTPYRNALSPARTPSQVSRRTIVTGAAWAVPAVALVSATPAFAASGNTLALTTTNMQVPASGAITITATVTTSTGAAVPGAAVSFTAPAGATLTPATATTNTSGVATTQLDLRTPWAKPGSTVTVSATNGPATTSAAFTVLGANVLVAGGGYTSSLTQPELVFPSPVTQAVAGIDGSSFWYMVVLQNGTVWTKGANSVGQLGDGTQTNRTTWAPVAGISTATKIAAGGRTAYALLSNGTVRAWGNGSSGALGNGGTTGSNSATPVTVSNVTGATQIAAAAAAGYALLSNGTVMAWGHNNNGQQGNGTIGGSQVSAVAIPALSGVTQICAGDYSAYALLSSGQIRAWGDNTYGQLGNGSNTSSGTPVNVSNVLGATVIAAAGSSAYAVVSGSLRAWGRNRYGQLGNGNTTDQNTHVAVSGASSDATQIGAGSRTAYALWNLGAGRDDVQAWGLNASGQLGNASTSDSSIPVRTTSLQGQSISSLPSTSLGSTLFLVTKV